jgi:hypothetical protein
MIIKLHRTLGGHLSVDSISDPVFNMDLIRTTEKTTAETPNHLPETRWMHPITQQTYVHNQGNLFVVKQIESETPWTYETTSLDLLLTI